jgi:hypothetical protein
LEIWYHPAVAVVVHELTDRLTATLAATVEVVAALAQETLALTPTCLGGQSAAR